MIKLLKLAQERTNNAWQVSQPEIPIKSRKKLSCRHDRRIREDKSPEQKEKTYQ